jgi:hypothetical protein
LIKFYANSILKWWYSTFSFNFFKFKIIRYSPFFFGLTTDPQQR